MSSKVAKMSQQYETWSDLASMQKWHGDWVDEVFTELGAYLRECAAKGRRAEFGALFDRLKKVAPKPD